MNIAVFGAGYVGLSNALLLAQQNHVTVYDISRERVETLARGVSPLRDEGIEEFLREAGKSLDFTVTADRALALKNADFVIVATPTDYDPEKAYFNTTSVEQVIAGAARDAPAAAVVIKSTIPVGFTADMRKRYPALDIMFSPEFLREGQALRDNLYPSRIIVGGDSAAARTYAALMTGGARAKSVPVLFMDSTEAEAVKLFANTFLALRVAYFNELDTYAELRGLNSRAIIEGICLDPRIGEYYNNPSFGYGGYCLPKDTKQLQANYRDVPNKLITAVVEANHTRKDHIAAMIAARLAALPASREPPVAGVYKLAMKADSDNARSSAILGIIERLKAMNIRVVIYDPALPGTEFRGCAVERDFAAFKQMADLIVANRVTPELAEVMPKVYTRDLFARD